MQQLESMDIESYLSKLASGDSTPGGGAAAGFSGAQAAALLSMVCNLSTGARFAEQSEAISAINLECEAIRKQLTQLAADDATVFNGVMAAYGLAKGTDEEKRNRTAAIQRALVDAAGVPLKVMQRVTELLPLADKLADIGNKNLISDVGVALYLVEATLHSARINVMINTKQIKDRPMVDSSNRDIQQCLATLDQFKDSVLSRVINQIS